MKLKLKNGHRKQIACTVCIRANRNQIWYIAVKELSRCISLKSLLSLSSLKIRWTVKVRE